MFAAQSTLAGHSSISVSNLFFSAYKDELLSSRPINDQCLLCECGMFFYLSWNLKESFEL